MQANIIKYSLLCLFVALASSSCAVEGFLPSAITVCPTGKRSWVHPSAKLTDSKDLFLFSRKRQSSLNLELSDAAITKSKSWTRWIRRVRLSLLPAQITRKCSRRIASAILALSLLLSPLTADARTSGGRMGGSFSSGRSRPMPTRSYTGHNTRNYQRSRPYYSSPPRVIVNNQRYAYGNGGVAAYSPARTMFLFTAVLIVVSALRSASPATLSGLDSRTPSALGVGTSVVQISVALEVSDRDDPNSILSVLDRLSETSQTDSRVGIQQLTNQVALELARRRSSLLAADSSYRHYFNDSKANQEFERRAIQERSKFEEETVNKFGGVDYNKSKDATARSESFSTKATYAVVTLLLAIDGDSTKVASINTIDDAVGALQLVASHAKVDECLKSCEILWTPQARGDSLSKSDLAADYPNLRML